jgi:outer membrane protein OmpA-like peptidoglycan-associated protein
MQLTKLLRLDLLRSAGVGVVATTVVACGGSVTPQLADARQAYEEAEDSSATTRAPGLLAEARVSLDRAERAHDDHPGSANERALAERAARKARHAKAHAENRDDDRYADEHDRELANAPAVTTDRDVRVDEHGNRVAVDDHGNRVVDEHGNRVAVDDRGNRVAVAKPVDTTDRPRSAKEAGAALQNLGKIATVKDDRRGTVITMADSSLFPARDEKISSSGRDNLDEIADALKQQPKDTTFHVRGYTDSAGSDSDNEKLSTRRAQAVADRLAHRGVDSSRMRVEGRGESDPVATNDNEEGRAANRRVEIVVDHND